MIHSSVSASRVVRDGWGEAAREARDGKSAASAGLVMDGVQSGAYPLGLQ